MRTTDTLSILYSTKRHREFTSFEIRFFSLRGHLLLRFCSLGLGFLDIFGQFAEAEWRCSTDAKFCCDRVILVLARDD